MKILLTSPTQQEIHPYLLSSPKHDILISGVGIHKATYELTHKLMHHRYDLVIQSGVAGSFGSYQPGDIVLVERDAFGDFGAYENGRFVSAQHLMLSSSAEWLVNPHQLLTETDIPKATAITVNTVTDNGAYIDAIRQKWNADIESMEGAVLHAICQRLNIPFLQVRSISNYVGERNKDTWEMQKAIQNLNDFVGNFVPSLLK